jgi:mannose-6-phosphate isomerase-like protein (cupin superfamily)
VHNEHYELKVGDSYCVPASQPHGYRTPGSEGADVLMAVTQRFIEISQPSQPRDGKDTQ